MKEFSKHWKASKKPKKQRKHLFNAPLHLRSSLASSKLSEELSKKYGMRNISIRKGDKVKIMRGQFRNKIGKVSRVDLKKMKIFVDGVEQNKIEGGKAPYPLHPSNVMITELETGDKKRFKHVKKEK